jgi:hypothetical protein
MLWIEYTELTERKYCESAVYLHNNILVHYFQDTNNVTNTIRGCYSETDANIWAISWRMSNTSALITLSLLLPSIKCWYFAQTSTTRGPSFEICDSGSECHGLRDNADFMFIHDSYLCLLKHGFVRACVMSRALNILQYVMDAYCNERRSVVRSVITSSIILNGETHGRTAEVRQWKFVVHMHCVQTHTHNHLSRLFKNLDIYVYIYLSYHPRDL